MAYEYKGKINDLQKTLKDVTRKSRQLNNRSKITYNEKLSKENTLTDRYNEINKLRDDIEVKHNELKNYQEIIGGMSPRPYQKSINIRESKLKQREIDLKKSQRDMASKVEEIRDMTHDLKDQLTEMQKNFDRKSEVKPHIDIT
jgi:uncharacterized protein YukE